MATPPSPTLGMETSGLGISLVKPPLTSTIPSATWFGVRLPDGTQIQYLIDGRNPRIGKKTNGTLVQGFLYDGPLNCVGVLDGAGNVVCRFVYGSRSDVPEYMVKGGSTYRFITDHLGSVRLVVNAATGQIVQRLD